MPYGDKADARSALRREIRATSKESGKERAAADRAKQRNLIKAMKKPLGAVAIQNGRKETL
jgi:hypothetical protein